MATTMTVKADSGAIVQFLGQPGSGGGPFLCLMHEFLQGWYSSPDLKVTTSPRQTGYGDFPHEGEDVLYEARTVSARVIAVGGSRRAVVAKAYEAAHVLADMVTVTVTDGDVSTWVRGYCQLTWEPEHYEDAMPGTITIVCDDPRRYGDRQEGFMVPGSARGALSYGDGTYIRFPLDFGQGDTSSILTITNEGNATCYPTISASGVKDLIIFNEVTGDELSFPDAPEGTPVVFDCLSRTASISGVDVTRRVNRRGFPSVPAGGSTTLSLFGSGGVVNVTWHDTYI